MLVECFALAYDFHGEFLSGLNPCHCLQEYGPLASFKGLLGVQSGEAAYVGDVVLGVVLGWRCPSADDLLNGTQPVLLGIGAQEAESRPDAPGHGAELHKVAVGLFLALSFPLRLGSADVQRVVVAYSSGHGFCGLGLGVSV